MGVPEASDTAGDICVQPKQVTKSSLEAENHLTSDVPP